VTAGEIWFEVEERIEAPIEEVFHLLVDPERYVRWMGVEATLEPHPGGAYRVRMPNGAVAVGAFVIVEPPRHVVFTWGWDGDDRLPAASSTVEISLHEREGATHLRLRHSGLPDEGSREAHTAGWRRYLARLAVLATGEDPGPDTEPGTTHR
jgi:uncharacterized protein YndB with AHSA1/START domain